MNTFTAMTIKSTDIQAGDRITTHAGPRKVAEVVHGDGVVNVYWSDGGYYGYYKVSATVEVLRVNSEGVMV